MDFNTFALRLGVDPGSFKNCCIEPIKTKDGFLYEVEQKDDERICPYCGFNGCIIHGYKTVHINCSDNSHIHDELLVRKVRLLCKRCHKTFFNPLKGVADHSHISDQMKRMIILDFKEMETFSSIARRYGLSTSRIIQIFDENIPFVPRRKLPRILCIDEIRFEEEINQKYCCVLYDFERKEIIDIIKNRQMAYLDEYFALIPLKERENVHYFISDMYDGYKTVKRKYFPKATHIVDLFHTISLMSNATRQIRKKAMAKEEKDSLSYRFMKSHWRLFECRKDSIPDKFYVSRKTGEIFHYDDLLFDCILNNRDLLESYNALQDLYRYDEYLSFEDSFEFIYHIAERLLKSGNPILESNGRSYIKWSVEIAEGLVKRRDHRRYTNGIAESINNHLKTIIKMSYGYHNFERFRKRALLIITYKKV